MSIPPLVCSTPPPPEQCEDDKDQEDFEINYNLSQEDDGNDYDYEKFSTFNNFELNTSKNYQEFATSQIPNNQVPKCDHTSVKHIISNETIREDKAIEIIVEDDVIEDLDLKIDHESASNVKNTTEDTTKSKETQPHDVKKLTEDLQEQQTNIPIDSIATSQELKLENVNIEHNNVENIEIIQTLNDDVNLEGLLNKVVSEKSSHSESTVCDNTTNNPSSFGITKYDNLIESINNEEEPHNSDEKLVQNDDEIKDIEDFEEFDDFQFVGSDKKTEPVIDTALENPWKNDDPQNVSFGEFTANFAESENKSTQSSEEQIHKQQDSDDDFGDFDEFKSVNDNEPSQVTLNPCEDVPVLNLHSTDSELQIIERINKVIHNIFPEEITEPENAFEGKLEVSLGETWGYLMETDVRQPYIVNWNNSLAQKTLLKALCIDSRNILFGPKWSSNMPKYAANLSAAPLQPQKQPGQPTITQIDATNSDKATNKPSWTDPFTSDGQESCNTENENAVIETGPTDLDVFEAAMSTKPDKIYSNTLSIQPIRQINLPDTHIFTPTNSEIPRSKTIHYDSTSAPTTVLPESVSDNTMTSQTSNAGNDYWEFQDFKGKPVSQVIDSSAKNDDQKLNEDNAVNKGVTLKSNYTLATQVLQPIKLEPIMPTLNWPDPGEVKETFDDFTDFISNSSLSNEKPEAILQSSVINIDLSAAPITLNNNIGNKKNEEKSSATSDKVDDDFEMFQSAMPPFKNNTRGESSNKDSVADYQNISPDEGFTKLTEFDRSLCKDDKIKSENISLSNTKSIDNVFKNVDTTSKINTFKPQQLPSTASQIPNTLVLQPTPVTSGVVTKQSQQKAGQILQPLSLESYSQINWPNPGIDLQDLSRFNPVESLQSLKNDSNSHSKTASPVHSHKSLTNSNQNADEDIWGDFVSSKPKQLQALPKKQATFTDDDEWTEFVSSPSVNPQNGLNTISLNVHTNSSSHKSSNSTKYPMKSNEIPLDIPALNYITPKTSTHKSYNDRHFQNL